MSASSCGRELTVREAARRVHRAEETIRRWIWAGKLPARKRGKGYQVDEGDLDAVAAGVPAPRGPGNTEPGTTQLGETPPDKTQADQPELDLAEWVAAVREWRAGIDVSPHRGAGQLVIEDRAERAERGDR